MKEEKIKNIKLTHYELAYRQYQECLTMLKIFELNPPTKFGLKDINNKNNNIKSNYRESLERTINLVHNQIKKYSKVELNNKLDTLNFSLNYEHNKEKKIILDTIELIKGCLALYPKLQLQ